MTKSIITIGIGHAGGEIAAKMLRTLANDIGGAQIVADTPFFSRLSNGARSPRVVFVDTDPRDGQAQRQRFATPSSTFAVHPSYIVSGDQSAARSFGRAYNGHVDTRIPTVLDRVQKLVDRSPSVDGFLLMHSLAGGTGSGLAAKLAEQLAAKYPKKTRISAALLPSVAHDPSPQDTINTALALHKLAPKVDLCLLSDNDALEALGGRVSRSLFTGRFARALANFAMCLQKERLSLSQISNHLRATTSAPFVLPSIATSSAQIKAEQQVQQILDGKGALASFGVASWRRPPLSSLLVWRGSYATQDQLAAAKALDAHSVKGKNSGLHVHVAKSEGGGKRALHAFSAHAGIGPMLHARILKPYEAMLEAGAFTGHARTDGISQSMLHAARSSLEAWVGHYAGLKR